MSRLAPEHQAAFVEAASAVLAQREMMDVVAEQDTSGKVLSPAEAESRQRTVTRIVQPSTRLYNILVKLRQRYPLISAYRFRGHVILLSIKGDEPVGMLVMPDRAIETVEE